MTYHDRTVAQHFADPGPKRILALDGGGLRGVLALGILKKIEDDLRQRHGNDESFRLCHYFDLMAGASTGAFIAATLAIGLSVDEIITRYFELGARVFQPSLLRHGFVRAKYDRMTFIKILKAVFGPDTTLNSDALKTGLLLMTKRLDSGSPWPINNNPNGKYFRSQEGGIIGNGDYKLWQAVRASTAAPDYFDPEPITIAEMPGHPPMCGNFVDGGISPFNNPALQAFMYATLGGYRVKWATGKDNILLVSVGTGAADPTVQCSGVAAKNALRALLSLLDDCATLQEVILQWMSQSPTARIIDSELGSLEGDLAGGTPLLSYLRYNVELHPDAILELLGDEANSLALEDLSLVDAPKNMPTLLRLGIAAGQRNCKTGHFPATFDLM